MKRFIILSLVLIFGSVSVWSQPNHTRIADKHFNKEEYLEAVSEYKKAILDKGTSSYAFKQLAKTYTKLRNFKSASYYMGRYVYSANAKDLNAADYLDYALLLRAEGKDEEADSFMEKFIAANPHHYKAKAYKENPEYMDELLKAPLEYEVNKLRINSKYQEFGAYEHNGDLYFVTARRGKGREYGWAGQPSLDIYVAENFGSGEEPHLIKGKVSTKFNEGSVVITKDGSTMYFTANDRLDPKYKRGVHEVSQLKVYTAKNVEGAWVKVQEASFSSSSYSVGNIALSPDENTLYFVSDMPGGYGGTDLYKVEILGDNLFGTPENLGEVINTPGDENFPFVDSQGTLYFSSDGLLGFGGLDVFKAEALNDGFDKPENMGKGVNSRSDDFSFVYFPEEDRGYLSSNRGSISDRSEIPIDDIYAVKKLNYEEIYEDLMVDLKVIDFETGRTIPNVKVTLKKGTKIFEEKISNEEGEIQFVMTGGDQGYNMVIEADEYESSVKVIEQLEGGLDVKIELVPVVKLITEEEIVLNPIHFETNKWDITPQGAYELDKLVDIMRKHTDIKVHVIAHTDNVGSRDYNQRLSERRARATVMYVLEQGIRPYRIDGEGVGMSRPKIDCTNCTEEERAINRRSEFRITER